ncbi:MAG: alpha/beta fold hydrolase [Planctomycetota bacterium]|nr:alpha/beta fold hydrolase [Planctomycetota bacterium]
MPRLYLFPGVGGNRRMFERLAVPGWDLVTLPLADPEPDEDLGAYAARMAAMQGLRAGDCVGGASMGGMVAAEIARRNGAACVVQLGSALTPRRVPGYLWLLESLSRILPDRAIAGAPRGGPPMRWVLGPISRADMDHVLAMEQACSTALLRRGVRMIRRWQGVADLPCPLYALHGRRDRVIRVPDPARFTAGRDRLELLDGAGHMLTITHAPHVAAFLEAALAPHRSGPGA